MYRCICDNGDKSVLLDCIDDAIEWGYESNMDFIIVDAKGNEVCISNDYAV
jgi:hypothetical protein